ncbi:MAG: hypothetical protein RJB36_1380 [Bacteroidota bacterium]|jgi:hypothetical protein
MKHLFFVVSYFLTFQVLYAQSDWTFKPYVVVNDSMYENLKHPVFIMDSTLFIRTAEGEVLTFPSSEVDYISKRCFYKRIEEREKEHLSRSGNTLVYFSLVSLPIGTYLTQTSISYWKYYGTTKSLTKFLTGTVIFIIPATITLHQLILHKRVNRMILESKGLKFRIN